MDEHDLPWEPGLAQVWEEMSREERDAFLEAEGEDLPPELPEAVRRLYREHGPRE
jgi:hypothetical protein